MKHHYFLLLFLACLFSRTGQAQTTASITTLPLEVSSVCPGSVIKVPFLYTGMIGKVAVQISDGNSFTTIYTEPKTYNYESRNPVSVYARSPDTVRTGKIYQVRVVSVDSSIVGRISPTLLQIRSGSKPPKPIVDSLQTTCVRITVNDYASNIYFKILPGVEPYVYGEKQDFPTLFTLYTSAYSQYIQLYKEYYRTDPCNNPSREVSLYFTQSLNGCESEKAKTIYRELCYGSAVKLDDVLSYGSYGVAAQAQIRYCQGDIALPLDKKGYSPGNPDMYVRFVYQDNSGPVSTTVIPIPNTERVGGMTYKLNSVPFDYTKICSGSYPFPAPELTVYVDPRPLMPVVPFPTTLTYYQNQPTVALTATSSSTATTLRWYLPDASGVPSVTSTTAPVPPTDRPGSFTYLVSQVQGNCESPLYPVTVNVLAPLAVDDAALSEQITVYPVPSSGVFTVDISPSVLNTKPAHLQLTDATGRVLWQGETRQNSTPVSVPSLTTGNYWPRVKIGERQAVKRVMKF